MEDEVEFFKQFENKDLTGIKKFNFKKIKGSEILKNTFSPSKKNAGEKNSTHQKIEVTSLPKYSFKKKETTFELEKKNEILSKINTYNHNVNTKDILGDVGLNIMDKRPPNKPNITSTVVKTDTVLDSLYKKTLSIKKNLIKTEKLNENQSASKLTIKQNKTFDDIALNTSETTKKLLSTNQNEVKSNNWEGSPSVLSEGPKLTSKGTFNISKYFNDGNETNKSRSSIIPFKKLLEAHASISTKKQESFTEKNQDICVSNNKTSDLTPLDSSSTISSSTTDSPIIKPKKFVFKKRPLSSSSSLTFSQEKNNFDDIFAKNIQESQQSTCNPTDIIFKSERTLINNLDFHNKTTNNKLNDLQNNDKKIVSEYDKVANSNEEQLFGRQSVSSSQSLQITDNDYMDDEEFERRFGNLADHFNESVCDSNQKNMASIKITGANTVQKLDHHNTEELLDEIKNINWDDNFFEEETIQQGFKDRDDDSDEFKGNYEHNEVMFEVLHQKFGLRSFRPHQKEVINASLTQHDCFVLMPTGGGKSLCYQLPAVLMPGVTVVISPLRALISDQVDKLNALDISAAHLCSDVSKADCEQIYLKLSMREPAIKLLYLTPEKICASRMIIDILNSLYHRGKLARFVIDEVHCLSQWGHDFRPDYKELSMLRKNYQDVPIICLTATATKQVEQDVINILSLKSVKRFIRSFNRPNIKYQVIPKTGKNKIEEIANLIRSKFQKKSGIVYCLGRKDCDIIAEKFNKLGIKSKPYHAGMNDKVREVIQREWMQDRFHVIVATIAFGMGIDKPDVRFVIHNSIPKSVEAFYQESGRAGRDGEVSYSYLFYSYGDVSRLQKLMQLDRNITKKTLDAHKENLKQMVSFAENLVDCRRYLQLLHLGEHFDRRICIRDKATVCDNCENIDKYQSVEVAKEAKDLCVIVKDLSNRDNVTMLYVADIYKGAKIKKILDRGHDRHPKYGAGSHMDRNDIHRILKELILKDILNDFCTYTGEFPVVYIKTGPKFYQFFNSDNYKLKISICTNKQRKSDVVRIDSVEKGINSDYSNDSLDNSKPSTSGIIRHTVQKQATAKLQATRKLQLTQLKVQCHEELLEECRRLAMERNLTLSSVMNLSAVKTMSDILPSSKEEMLKIQHVTNANYNKYGDNFLEITRKFREKHDALLPLTVVSKPDNFNERLESFSDDEYQDDFHPSFSQNSSRITGTGVKRKRNWVSKKGGGYKKKRRLWKKKGKSSPKSKVATSSGWKGKGGRGGGKGGGTLGLMPLHIK